MSSFSTLAMMALFLMKTVAAQRPDRGSCSCTEDADNLLARYEEEAASSTIRIVRTNGIPSHQYHHNRQRVNPNPVCMRPSVIRLPMNPLKRRTAARSFFSDTPMGIIGVLKTGAFLYNHKSNRNGINDVANHPNNEQPGLDGCHGHANGQCVYHYHEISKLPECTHDEHAWDSCEQIGWLLDGFPIYSHCFHPDKQRFLTSCYALTNDSDGNLGDDTSDYTHSTTADCDLDVANGFDFTGSGIVDAKGNVIQGYGYIASDSYPYVMAAYAGTTWASVETLVEWPSLPSTNSRSPAPVSSTERKSLAPVPSPIQSPVSVAPATAPSTMDEQSLAPPVPSGLSFAPVASPVESPFTASPLSLQVPTSLSALPASTTLPSHQQILSAKTAAPENIAETETPAVGEATSRGVHPRPGLLFSLCLLLLF